MISNDEEKMNDKHNLGEPFINSQEEEKSELMNMTNLTSTNGGSSLQYTYEHMKKEQKKNDDARLSLLPL